MAPSVQLDIQGPDWPLGFIKVVTPGTPVNIMSLVDPTSLNAPQTLDPNVPTASPGTAQQEYTVRAQQIIFVAYKPGASHGTTPNAGNIYIVRQGVQGAGNRDDTGSIVYTIPSGGVLFLGSAATRVNVFSPYRYSIDADNANDGCFVTLLLQ